MLQLCCSIRFHRTQTGIENNADSTAAHLIVAAWQTTNLVCLERLPCWMAAIARKMLLDTTVEVRLGNGCWMERECVLEEEPSAAAADLVG